MIADIEPELMGIYNTGVRGAGGGGSSGAQVTFQLPEATLTTAGGVQTRNSSDGSVTSETVSVVPTQYYVQQEISRLESSISSGGGGTQQTGTQPSTANAWVSTTDLGSSATFTFSAGSSYIADASEGQHTLTAVTSSGMCGPDAHLILYLGAKEDMTLQAPVAVKGELHEYSMNACTLKFWNGTVYMLVDFYTTGFHVTVSNGTTGSGGICSAAHPSVGFSDNLNGSAISLEDAVATSEKTLSGNGRGLTILSGGVTCNQPVTFEHLTFDGATVGGTSALVEDVSFVNCTNNASMTFRGTNYITALTGSGGIYVTPGAEINGPGTIDMMKKHSVRPMSSGSQVIFNSITFTSGSAANGGAAYVAQNTNYIFNDCNFTSNTGNNGTAISFAYHGYATFNRCTFLNNSGGKGTINTAAMCSAAFTSCVISSNTANSGGAVLNTEGSGGKVIFTDCLLDGTVQLNGSSTTIIFSGSNAWGFGNTKQNGATSFRIISGGTMNLTGNAGDTSGNIIANAAGSIEVGYYNGSTWTQGGSATVINSAGEAVTIQGSGTTLSKDGTLS